MKCAWLELLSILPQWMRHEMDKRCKDDLQEIRLRIKTLPSLFCHGKTIQMNRIIVQDDLNYIINTASRYSPWSAASISYGYITAPGGHRIGICGEAIMQNGVMTGIRRVDSLCIRVARDFSGLASKVRTLDGNTLIIGPPGSGKTTFLRDLIRQRSSCQTVAVVDERGEIFPNSFYRGENTDVLIGADKESGIDCMIRTMNPHTVAVDEITSERDCIALQKASWCGVDLIATAHAGSVTELYSRTLYKPLIDQKIFCNLIVLSRAKTWHVERMEPC